MASSSRASSLRLGGYCLGMWGFLLSMLDSAMNIAHLFCILKDGSYWKSKAPRDWRHAGLVARMLGDKGMVNLQFAR